MIRSQNIALPTDDRAIDDCLRRLAWDLTGGRGIDEGTLTEVTALLAPHEVPELTAEE